MNGATTSSAADSTAGTSTPVLIPIRSNVAASTSVGAFPAPAPSAQRAPSICRAPADADHVPDLHLVAALELGQQVGADVARADDRRRRLAHLSSCTPSPAPGPARSAVNRAVTLPSPAKVAVTVSPGPTGIAAVTEPGRMTWPGSRTTPRSPTVLASQTSAVSGEPSTAPPAPVPASCPFLCRLQPASRRSAPA